MAIVGSYRCLASMLVVSIGKFLFTPFLCDLLANSFGNTCLEAL